MKIGDWEYPLPRYMRRVLEIAGLADADYTIEEFIEKIVKRSTIRIKMAKSRCSSILQSFCLSNSLEWLHLTSESG